jgi:hypothetical protein
VPSRESSRYTGGVRARIAVVLLLSACRPAAPPPDPSEAIRAADIRKHQSVLASEAFEGRGAGTEGGRRAAEYLADQVRTLGWGAAGTDGTYFQPFGEGRRNVVARWPGAPGDEYIVVGAHFDHLGRKGDKVYPGADDNASGSSTVLDVAGAVARSRFRRSVVCIWFDEEENNLAGSRWWTDHPTLPLDRCYAMLNCDMIGRNDITKIFCGVEKTGSNEPKYPKWAQEVRAVESRFGTKFDWTEFDPYIRRSDHWPFMEKGVPALFFTGGLHADYHGEGDRIEKINFAKEELIGRILYAILARAAERSEPLK